MEISADACDASVHIVDELNGSRVGLARETATAPDAVWRRTRGRDLWPQGREIPTGMRRLSRRRGLITTSPGPWRSASGVGRTLDRWLPHPRLWRAGAASIFVLSNRAAHHCATGSLGLWGGRCAPRTSLSGPMGLPRLGRYGRPFLPRLRRSFQCLIGELRSPSLLSGRRLPGTTSMRPSWRLGMPLCASMPLFRGGRIRRAGPGRGRGGGKFQHSVEWCTLSRSRLWTHTGGYREGSEGWFLRV